jgi:urocanate hydratase
MSGAQPKAGNIAGVVTICAEVNATAAHKRQSQGWVDEVIDDVDVGCIDAALAWQKKGEAHSIAFLGNVVDLWERLAERKPSRWTWAATRPACTTRGPAATTRWA